MMKSCIFYVMGIKLLMIHVSQSNVVESHNNEQVKILSEARDYEKVHYAEKLSYQINEIPVHEKGDAKTKYKLKAPVILHLLKTSPQKKAINKVDTTIQAKAKAKQNIGNNNQNTATTDKVKRLTTNTEETSNSTICAQVIKENDKKPNINADQKIDPVTTVENEDDYDYGNMTCPTTTIDYNNAEERKVKQIQNGNMKNTSTDSENKYPTLSKVEEIEDDTESVMSTVTVLSDKKEPKKKPRIYGYFFPVGYVLLSNGTNTINNLHTTTAVTTSKTTSKKPKYANWWFRRIHNDRKE